MNQGDVKKTAERALTRMAENSGKALGSLRSRIYLWGRGVADSMRELLAEAREEYEAEQVALEEVRNARAGEPESLR